MTKQEAFSHGFDAGNYGNAYESEDWETWYAEHCDTIPAPHRDEYQAGMLLGFFSSYELHEIPDDMIAEEVTRLRSLYPEGNI